MIVEIPEKVLQLMKKPAENGNVIHYETGNNPKLIVKKDFIIKNNSLVFSSFPDSNSLTIGTHTKKNIKRNIPVSNILNYREQICDGLMERMLQYDELNIYVKLDVLDPSVVDVGQDYGGLTARQLIYFLQRLAKLRNLRTVSIQYFTGTERISAKLALEVVSNFIN